MVVGGVGTLLKRLRDSNGDVDSIVSKVATPSIQADLNIPPIQTEPSNVGDSLVPTKVTTIVSEKRNSPETVVGIHQIAESKSAKRRRRKKRAVQLAKVQGKQDVQKQQPTPQVGQQEEEKIGGVDALKQNVKDAKSESADGELQNSDSYVRGTQDDLVDRNLQNPCVEETTSSEFSVRKEADSAVNASLVDRTAVIDSHTNIHNTDCTENLSSQTSIGAIQEVALNASTSTGDAENNARQITTVTGPISIAGVKSSCTAQTVISQRPNSSTNFFKGVKYSPDGTCLLYATENTELSVCNNSNWSSKLSPAITAYHGEGIYDYCWYPFMNSATPATCCFLSTSKDHPIQLWDAYTGSLRATYTARNHLDELDPAISVSFSLDGSRILAGYDRCFRVFHCARPGANMEEYFTCPSRRSKEGQRGLLSCITCNPDYSGIVAIGSYSGSLVLYSESDPACVLADLDSPDGHVGGITGLKFSPDGRYLFSGARKDNEILCWDIRKSSEPVLRLPRNAGNNQRIHFDINATGTKLITGTTDSKALIYKLPTGELEEVIVDATVIQDTVNGVTFNPTVPDGSQFVLATGSRHMNFLDDSDDSDVGKIWMASLSSWITSTSTRG